MISSTSRLTLSFLVLALLASPAWCGTDAIFGDGFESRDAAAWSAAVPPVPPALLSQTGLYSDIVNKVLAPNVETFTVLYELWVDGAEQERFVLLPPGAQIDSSDMDDWSLPVGTRLWKQVSSIGPRLWTEYIERWGPGANDFNYAAYVWIPTESDATLDLDGLDDVRGTSFDLPGQNLCRDCHGWQPPGGGGLPSRALGFAAIQLSHSMTGVNLDSLIDDNRLTLPPAGPFAVPGGVAERTALGYLHANCGNCHNSSPDGIAFPAFDTRLETSQTSVAATGAFLTLVDQPVSTMLLPCTHRIRSGDVGNSCVHARMMQRGPGTQMPPPAMSDVADPAGLAAIESWILALSP